MAAGKYKTDQNYDDDIDFIKDSDAVQGDPPGTDPDNTPLTGPINVVIQKMVSSLSYLKDAIENYSIARMTDSIFGTGRTATQQEAEDGAAHGAGGPVLTPLRGKQAIDVHALNLLRSALAAANTSRLGTVRRATQAQATGLTDTERYLTAALVNAILQHANAEATTSRRGTVQRADDNDIAAGTNTTKHVTPKQLNDAVDKVPDFEITAEAGGSVTKILEKQIGKLIFVIFTATKSSSRVNVTFPSTTGIFIETYTSDVDYIRVKSLNNGTTGNPHTGSAYVNYIIGVKD